jgi:hypothetical protein
MSLHSLQEKHTPGPWTVTNADHVGEPTEDPSMPPYWFIDGGKCHAHESRGFHVSAYMKEADARLIAAAPELLEACQIVLAYLDKLEFGIEDNDPLREIRQRCHAPLRAALETAISKAEGQ